MPGIVGLVTGVSSERARERLLKMVQSICHEQFYTTGTWMDADQGVYVGWAAPRGCFADDMPIHNERKDVTLFFSGEEFPEPGMMASLRAHGHNCAMEGPSYLVHRYEEEADFPRGLNGRFHGLLVDRTRRKLMLFNDRYGLQRLYYYQDEDTFYFSAEAKAILKVQPKLRKIDPRGLGEFIVCGCVLENRTLFRGIHVLPPGSAWCFHGAVLAERTSYFQAREWEEQEALAPESYYAQMREAFVDSLPRYFDGREKIGVSLTGGLDTRIIMAWSKAPKGSLPCYTFGSTYRDNQDVRLARRVAEICGQQHQVITTGHEFLSRFPHYAERSVYLADGCIDLSRAPDLYVNEKAREIAPVRMVGTYGSEIMSNAVMFKPTEPPARLFQPEVLRHVQAAKQTYDAVRRVHPVTFIAFRQSPWHHFGVLGLEQTQVTVRTPFLDNSLLKTVYQAPGSVLTNEEARLRLVREGNPALAKLRTDRGIGGSNAVLKHWILEFLFKAEYGYDMGMPQWVAQLDHMLAPLHLERLWLGRHKPFHFRVWYRDQLANYVREMLLDPLSLARPYLVPETVRNIVNGHLRGNRNYTTDIHRLIALELVQRLFLNSN